MNNGGADRGAPDWWQATNHLLLSVFSVFSVVQALLFRPSYATSMAANPSGRLAVRVAERRENMQISPVLEKNC